MNQSNQSEKAVQPAETGSTGTQVEPAEAPVTGEIITKESSRIFPNTIEEATADYRRGLASSGSTTLLKGWALQQSMHLERAQNELDTERNKNVESLEMISDMRETIARLETKLDNENKNKTPRGVTIFVGATFLTFALGSILDGDVLKAAISALIGLLLTATGFDFLPKRKEK